MKKKGGDITEEKEEILRAAAERLLSWYPAHQKPLPWREDVTPYRVLVSETMLQQTRTAAVIPYYLRFTQTLPRLQDLADVPDDVLMKLWQGLGYYSRARNLKIAAQTLVYDRHGEWPHTAAELKKLKGVGDYTAGAIASIAFGEPEPAVDGNVLRVVSRLLADSTDVLSPAAKKETTARLRLVYPAGKDAATLTQAWMELGENVCIPNGEAHCDACPLADICLAKRGGTVSLYPYRSPKKPRRIEEKTVFILTDGDKYALRKRPAHGLLSGLYEFPNTDGTLTEEGARSHLCDLGYAPSSLSPVGTATHVFTHIEWHMTGYLVRLSESASPRDGAIFATRDEIAGTYAIPSAFRWFLSFLGIKNKKTDR